MSARGPRWLEALAVAAFVAWCAWWGLSLSRGDLPAAPLLALTGIPAPTTGFTRSLASLASGDVRASLALNPFAVPIATLLVASLGLLAARGLRRRPLLLPAGVARLWLVVLALAFLAKLVV